MTGRLPDTGDGSAPRYFVAFDLSVEEYRTGLTWASGQAYTFVEFAAFLARYEPVHLFIDGMANECSNRGVMFRDLRELGAGFFRGCTAYLYARSMDSLRASLHAFDDCRLVVFIAPELRARIEDIRALFQGQALDFIGAGREHDVELPLLARFQREEAQRFRCARTAEAQDPLTMFATPAPVVVLADCTWGRAAERLVAVMREADPAQRICVLDADGVVTGADPMVSIVDPTRMAMSALGELFEQAAVLVYGGIGRPHYRPVFDLAQRLGAVLVPSTSLAAQEGAPADRFFHELVGDERGIDWLVRWLASGPSGPACTAVGGRARASSAAPPRDASAGTSTVYAAGREAVLAKDTVRVVWIGRFDFVGGYGAVARGYLSAMEAAGLPCLCIDIDSKKPVGKASGFFWEHDMAARRYVVDGPAIIVLNDIPTRYPRFRASGFLRRIACTLFETDSFPVNWVDGFRHVDEVWVPTEFNRRTFGSAGVPQDRLRVVGYSVDTDYFAPVNRTANRQVRLLYMLSNLNRKDPGLLIRAYFSAFRRGDPVRLTIKTRLSEARFRELVGPQLQPRFDFDDPDNPEIRFITGTVSEDVIRSLYEDTDIYVTTERAKGWDYPVMEAMAMGIPSVAIDWSGSEFLNRENAFLIPARQNLALAHPTQVDNGEMYFGHRWADVNEADVVATLRRAVADRGDILQRGLRCRADVMRYHPAEIGRDIRAALDAIDTAGASGTAVLQY